MSTILKYSFLSCGLLAASLIAACSSSFVASSNAQPQETFNAACVGCHKPLTQHADKYFALGADKRNVAYVSNHIMHGSMFMPSYPHISGAELTALSQFVIDHSVEK